MRRSVGRLMAAGLAFGLLPIMVLAQSADFEDVRLAERAVQNALEQYGATLACDWRNPSTGVGGKVAIVRSGLAPNGQTCREYTHIWQLPATETTYRGIRCREENGLWKLVEPEEMVAQVARAVPPAEPPPVHANAGDVRRLQAALKDLLYLEGAVDGVMDERTREARDRFVEDEQLILSGEPDLAALADHAGAARGRQRPVGSCPVPAPHGKLIGCGVF